MLKCFSASFSALALSHQRGCHFPKHPSCSFKSSWKGILLIISMTAQTKQQELEMRFCNAESCVRACVSITTTSAFWGGKKKRRKKSQKYFILLNYYYFSCRLQLCLRLICWSIKCCCHYFKDVSLWTIKVVEMLGPILSSSHSNEATAWLRGRWTQRTSSHDWSETEAQSD